jgi:hypothetical protein
MKGRVFKVVLALMVIFGSVNLIAQEAQESAKPQIPSDWGNHCEEGLKIKFDIDVYKECLLEGVNNGFVSVDKMTKLVAEKERQWEDVIGVALETYQTYAAYEIYKKQIEADKEIQKRELEGFMKLQEERANIYMNNPYYNYGYPKPSVLENQPRW